MSFNPIRPWRNIDRRKSRQIMVGNVAVGGGAPISVQTMTNTITSDVKATLEQVQRLRSEHAIYMVDDSRINVAGLPDERLDQVAAAIVSVLGD